MDNTELHYITYDPDEIWNEMMSAYVEAGGDILYPGDEKEMLLRSVQAIIVQMFSGVDNALRMQTLRYATGEYLDIIGELRGCERKKGTYAEFQVNITVNDSETQQILPAGTEMTIDGSIIFATTEDVILPISGSESVTVKAETVGKITFAEEKELSLLNPVFKIRRIVMSSVPTGGSEEETDDLYRERIRVHGFSSVTAGPSQQYENIAKTVNRVLDAKAINGGAGVVNVYLVVDGDPFVYLPVRLEVSDALNAYNVRPLTDSVVVNVGYKNTYTLNVKYSGEGITTQNEVKKAVDNYKEWQDNKLGRAFNPEMLVSMIYQAGATRVKIGPGSTFNGKEAAYEELSESEYCVGEINLEVI